MEGTPGTGQRIILCRESPQSIREIITPWNKKDKFFETADPAEDQKLIFLGDKREDLRWRKSNEDSYLIRGEEVVKIKEFP